MANTNGHEINVQTGSSLFEFNLTKVNWKLLRF